MNRLFTAYIVGALTVGGCTQDNDGPGAPVDAKPKAADPVKPDADKTAADKAAADKVAADAQKAKDQASKTDADAKAAADRIAADRIAADKVAADKVAADKAAADKAAADKAAADKAAAEKAGRAPLPTTALSGQWMLKSIAADFPKEATTGLDEASRWYLCKSFVDINEAKKSIARGYYCYVNQTNDPGFSKGDTNIYVEQVGTIVSISGAGIQYTVTGGCDTADLNKNLNMTYNLKDSTNLETGHVNNRGGGQLYKMGNVGNAQIAVDIYALGCIDYDTKWYTDRIGEFRPLVNSIVK